MQNKDLSAEQNIKNNTTSNTLDVIFEKVKNVQVPLKQQVLSNRLNMGIKVQSVAIPNGFTIEAKSEREISNWLGWVIKNVFYASRVFFLKYNSESLRQDWLKNTSTNKRYLEIKNLYKDGIIYHKLL